MNDPIPPSGYLLVPKDDKNCIGSYWMKCYPHKEDGIYGPWQEVGTHLVKAGYSADDMYRHAFGCRVCRPIHVEDGIKNPFWTEKELSAMRSSVQSPHAYWPCDSCMSRKECVYVYSEYNANETTSTCLGAK